MQKQNPQVLFIIGGTLTILGAIAHLLEIPYSPYLFSVGAAILIYIQGINVADNWKAEKRKQRLARIGLISSLLLALAAYFMFVDSNT